MALLVGLTGGMGSGKTTVAKYFKALGAYVLDADEICRSLVEPEKPAWREIIDLLGNGILRDDQTLDRRKIADIVFNDPEKKKALETILHPRVMAEEQAVYKDILQDDPGALVIIDAALLIESENYRKVDKVIVIACDEETQLHRIMAKNMFSRKDAQNRLRLQMPLEEKIKFADYVLHNDSGLSELKKKVESLFHQLKQLAA
ncbi:MAG: dephospho-CoA kinase [Nitrospinota bacterium]|nr:dephospho-CoA kinase [Nitrospinota bacterium]